jgi:hypothetical protein
MYVLCSRCYDKGRDNDSAFEDSVITIVGENIPGDCFKSQIMFVQLHFYDGPEEREKSPVEKAIHYNLKRLFTAYAHVSDS